MTEIKFFSTREDGGLIKKSVHLSTLKKLRQTQFFKFIADTEGVYISSSIVDAHNDERSYFNAQLTETQFITFVSELNKLIDVEENKRLSLIDFASVVVNEKGFEQKEINTINYETIETIFEKRQGNDTLRIRHFHRLGKDDLTNDFTIDNFISEIASLRVPYSKKKLSQLLDIVLNF